MIRLGLQAALARAASRGEEWDQRLDSELDIHRVWPDSDFLFETHAAPVIRRAVSALLADRVEPWLEAQLDGERPTTPRVLCCVPLDDRAALQRRQVDVELTDVKGLSVDFPLNEGDDAVGIARVGVPDLDGQNSCQNGIKFSL